MNPAEPNTNPTAGAGPDPAAPAPTPAPAPEPVMPVASAPAPEATVPATDPLAPATNTPDGQAMVDQALGTADAYGADPLAGIPAASEPVVPTPGPETGTMVDPLAAVPSGTPATDPLVAAPATDPFAAPAATPAPADPLAAVPAAADPDPLAGAVESLSSAPMDANPSAEPTTDYSQPAAPNFANDPSVAAAPEKVNDETPIQPAAPAPGSIGSSTSYTDYQAAAANAAPAGKKKKTTMILLIVVIALVIIGGGVFAFIMLTSNSSSSNKNSNTGNNNSSTPAPADPVALTMTCTASHTGSDLATAGNANTWDEEIVIKYEDDEITKITDVSTVEYADAATAKSGIETFKNYYAKLLEDASLRSDPFDSRYARVDGTLTVTYTGLGERLNAQNAVIFNLPVEDEELQQDTESVNAHYTQAGFTCQEKED